MRMFSVPLAMGLCVCVAAAQTGPPAKSAPNTPADEKAGKRPALKQAERRPPLPKSHLALLHVRLPAVEFEDTPLQEVFDWLAETLNANLIVHWNKMAEAGVEATRPVSLRANNLRVSQVLWLLLNQAANADAKLAYRASSDMIVISTVAEFEENLVTQVYDVRDLVRSPRGPDISLVRSSDLVIGQSPIVGPGSVRITPILRHTDGLVRISNPPKRGGRPEDNLDPDDPNNTPEQRAARLIDAIVESVEPESWQINGGRGTIRFFDGRLVVRNTAFVQQKIGGYLR